MNFKYGTFCPTNNTIQNNIQMKKILNLKSPILQGTVALLTVLIIDIFSPLGISVGILYLFCFFLICQQNKKTIIVFAVISIVLTIIKPLVFYSQITSFAIYNRAITVFVLLIITLLALRHRKLADTIIEERKIYISELEKMLFMTSHRVRKPVASCLGLMNILENKQPMTVEELEKIVSHFKSSALELDEFTKELIAFIHNIKIESDSAVIREDA